MRPLRIAVVGGGHMGQRHAEKVAALASMGAHVRLVGITDVDPARARGLAAETGCRAYSDRGALFAASDAAIVAVPTVAHFPVVESALGAGLDVLVEKPIAATLEEAESLLARARRGGRVLQVGHLEWFNPAMRAIRRRVRRPRFVEAHRLGPFPERAADVDVVRELMIHDIDILQQLLGEEPTRIEAIGLPVITDTVDIANARLVLPGGCVANLTASRVSPTPMRRIRFFQRDGYFSVDFLAQSAVVVRRRASGRDGTPRIHYEELKGDPEDALTAQLRHFIESVRTRAVPAVSGPEALGALRTALRVVEAMPPPGALA